MANLLKTAWLCWLLAAMQFFSGSPLGVWPMLALVAAGFGLSFLAIAGGVLRR